MRRAILRFVFSLLLVLYFPYIALGQSALINGNRVLVGTLNYCDAIGSTGDAYVCNLNPAITAYIPGARYFFKASANNVGAATLNLNGLGAITIVKAVGGVPTTLADNDIRLNQYVEVVYDAAGPTMQMLSLTGTAATGSLGIIASGSLTLSTSSVASGVCNTAQTVTATGTTTADVVTASFNGDVTSVTGYTASTSGALRVEMFPTANAANFRLCNSTANTITPGSAIINWKVLSTSGMVASGSLALGTSSIASGACTTEQTVSASGVLTTDEVLIGFNQDVTSITGYTASTNGALRVDAYPKSDAIGVRVCNATITAITPGAVTLNYRVLR